MSVSPPTKDAFDLKSTAWTLTVLRLQTASVPELQAALEARFGDSPGLFEHDPVLLDLSPLREAGWVLDYDALLPLIRQYQLVPVAVQGGNPEQTSAALAAGLPEAQEVLPARAPAAPPPALDQVLADGAAPAPDAAAASTAAAATAAATDPKEAAESAESAERVREQPVAVPTLVVDKPLRSGQRVYARGDLVVMAAVSFGAEVIADGHIHVYAPLRGRAMAGARGNAQARIFCTSLDPQLISIAGIYRTAENPLPAAVQGRPAQVRLEGERLLIEPIAG